MLTPGLYLNWKSNWSEGFSASSGMRKGSSRIPTSKQGWKPCRRFDQMLWPSSGRRSSSPWRRPEHLVETVETSARFPTLLPCFQPNTSFKTGLKTLPTFRPDALAFFRAKIIFALKKARASGRNVGKVFNPVLKLVFENYPFWKSNCCRKVIHLVRRLWTSLKGPWVKWVDCDQSQG